MEFKIIHHTKNTFLHREECLIEIESNFSPTFNDVKDFLKKNQDLLVIKSITGNFGSNKFKSEVFIYDSKKYKEETEVIPKKIRKKLEEERKKQEAQQKSAEGVQNGN